MVRSLRWKATVVLSIMLSASAIATLAQPTSVKANITYTCRAERLESVIQYLSNHSGYDFIYSRDLVDISRPVSLTVKNKTINEVLSLIEKQVSVSFRLKDHHIIVKNVPKPKAEVQTAKDISPPALESADSLLITSISRTITVMAFESQSAQLQSHLDRRINEVQRMLGTTVPHNIPSYYIDRINFNNRHRSWYASVGTVVGDNGSGVELQAGLPYLYAVFNPTITLQGFSGSYGVGNSFNLVGNFSFNTIYVYSSRRHSESIFPFPGPYDQTGPEIRRTQTVRQHQIKMTVQYAFSRNITLRVGPVLNYRSTMNEISIISGSAVPESNYSYQAGSIGNVSIIYQNGQPVSTTRTTRRLESWIGWDASIQYRINFFDHK